jgi:uncharacterized protein
MRKLERAVLWRGIWLPGADYCELWRDDLNWLLEGTAVVAMEGRPLAVRYIVTCDNSWKTRFVEISLWSGTDRRGLEMLVDDQGRWSIQGRQLAELGGCVDVDLGVTPATNTLPVRRLGLALGQGADVTAAWVKFPELTVEPLDQRYNRLSEHRYRYQSGGGSFETDIEVDDLGLVTRYVCGWEREA